MRGVEKLRVGKFPDTHVDVWRRFGETLAKHPSRGIRVLKVESHLNAEEAIEQRIDPATLFVNAIADTAASRLAEKFRVSFADRCRVEMATAVGSSVRKHLAKVLEN
eukprot:4905058-Pyramimonas_sp.AAC.1